MDPRSEELGSPPAIYVDMTGHLSNLSRSMATGCLRRDLSQLDPFMRAVFLIRYLDEALEKLARNPRVGKMLANRLEISQTPAYLHELVSLIEDPSISIYLDAAVTNRIDEIIELNKSDDDEDVVASDAERMVDRLYSEDKTPLEQMQELLFAAQQSVKSRKFCRFLQGRGQAQAAA